METFPGIVLGDTVSGNLVFHVCSFVVSRIIGKCHQEYRNLYCSNRRHVSPTGWRCFHPGGCLDIASGFCNQLPEFIPDMCHQLRRHFVVPIGLGQFNTSGHCTVRTILFDLFRCRWFKGQDNGACGQTENKSQQSDYPFPYAHVVTIQGHWVFLLRVVSMDGRFISELTCKGQKNPPAGAEIGLFSSIVYTF